MLETKAGLERRLRADGRWPQFVKLRESFKKEGLPPPEAWAKALESFPPPDGKAELAPAVPFVQLVVPATDNPDSQKPRPDPRRRPDIRKDIEYAYQNMDEKEPCRPPSAGARGMLKFAKDNPGVFLREFVRELLPAKKDLDKGTGKEDGPLLGLVQKLIDASTHSIKEQPDVLPASPEGRAEESRVPAGHAEGLQPERVSAEGNGRGLQG